MRLIQLLCLGALAPVLSVLAASCSGGGGGGGGGGPLPEADLGPFLPTVALTSAAPGHGAAQVRWDGRDADGTNRAIAIFRSSSAGTLFSGAPVVNASGPGSTVVSGLSNGSVTYFGIALDLGGSYVPVGTHLTVVARAPIHVDAASTATNPDGASPSTAFPNLSSGIQAAITAGGGNVWVAEGTYTNVAASIPGGVSIIGGFAAGFALAARDPEAHVTTLTGAASTAVLELVQGTGEAALDGLVLDGSAAAAFGVDVDSTDARLSALVVRNTTSHGVRLRSTNTVGSPNVDFFRARVTGTGGQGVSVFGTFDLKFEGSRFSSNAQEGLGLDPLVAPSGVSASLAVRDCVFASNGEDGLDCHLGAPPIATGSSSYRVTIDGSRFEENGWSPGALSPVGLRVDIEHDLIAGWSSDVLVRGCTSRANRGAGVHLDLDSTSTTFVHRLLSIGNAGDGLSVTSESTAAIAVVDSSVFEANGGVGLRASLGNVPVTAAHCVFAGNAGGGFTSSTVTSLASSCVAWKQATPFTGVRQHFDVIASNELSPAFTNAPVQYQRVTAASGTVVTLNDSSSIAVGDPIELAADGTTRAVGGLAGPNQLTVTPAPTELDLPASFARFAVGAPVVEDYSLPVGSPASAAGLPPVSGGSTDAGPFGAAIGGAPGNEGLPRPELFRVASTSPPVTTALGSSTTITVSFAGGALNAASITNRVRVRNGAGTALSVSASVASGVLQVLPPGGGWPTGDLTLELHAGLASTNGDVLPAAIALPFRR